MKSSCGRSKSNFHKEKCHKNHVCMLCAVAVLMLWSLVPSVAAIDSLVEKSQDGVSYVVKVSSRNGALMDDMAFNTRSMFDRYKDKQHDLVLDAGLHRLLKDLDLVQGGSDGHDGHDHGSHDDHGGHEGHDHGSHDDHSGHNHRRRREIHDHSGHNHGAHEEDEEEMKPMNITEGCAILSEVEQIMMGFPINLNHFIALMPRLLQYKISGKEPCQIQEEQSESNNSVVSWVVATVSVGVISLISIVGIATIPLMKFTRIYHITMNFLVAMAVGTMCGDAVLHLLPHAQMEPGHHNHDHSGIYKNLMGVAGIYLFFLFETTMSLFRKSKKNSDSVELGSMSGSTHSKGSSNTSKSSGIVVSQNLPSEENKGLIGDKNEKVEVSTVDVESGDNHHHHSHHHHHHDQKEMLEASQGGVLKMAYMIIVGDGLHNFSDGLAIGAAFTGSMAAGLSTSVAILLHELPQELGDFALLLRSGMSIKKAVLFNLMSACLAFFGTFIGLALGEMTEGLKPWILAMTAGGFLYVSLVNMLPCVVAEAGDRSKGWFNFFIINLGIVSGFLIMLFIALNEAAFEKIIPH